MGFAPPGILRLPRLEEAGQFEQSAVLLRIQGLVFKIFSRKTSHRRVHARGGECNRHLIHVESVVNDYEIRTAGRPAPPTP